MGELNIGGRERTEDAQPGLPFLLHRALGFESSCRGYKGTDKCSSGHDCSLLLSPPRLSAVVSQHTPFQATTASDPGRYTSVVASSSLNHQVLCSSCGQSVPPDALVCPHCQQLVHAQELRGLAAQAADAMAKGDRIGARDTWQSALALIPETSPQYQAVLNSVKALSRQIAAGPAESAPAASNEKPAWVKRLGP